MPEDLVVNELIQLFLKRTLKTEKSVDENDNTVPALPPLPNLPVDNAEVNDDVVGMDSYSPVPRKKVKCEPTGTPKPSEKSSTSGSMMSFFGSETSLLSARELACNELRKYMSEPVPSSLVTADVDLRWWHQNESKYNKLATMAKRYLSTSASIVSA